LAFAMIVAAGMSVVAADKAPSLDGKSFHVQLMKGDAKTGDPDTLSFAAGMFDSSACHQYGFGKSAYTSKNAGSKISFQVHAVGKDESKQVWNGTVDGNKIHGTMTQTDPKGTVTTFRFEGESHA